MSEILRLEGMPMIPSDNRLYRHGLNSYASAEYAAWLTKAREILLDALGPDHTPDGESWFGVTIRLRMNQGDGSNRQKGVLDWLSGRYPLEHAGTVNGKKKQKGALVNGVGLWVDDKRVRYVLPIVESVRSDEPSFDLTVRRVRPPVDERAEAEAAEKARLVAAKAEAERFFRGRIIVVISADPSQPWSADRIHAALKVEALGHGATPAGLTAVRRSLAELESSNKIVRDGRGWRLAT